MIFKAKVLFHSSLTMKQYYDQFNEIDHFRGAIFY